MKAVCFISLILLFNYVRASNYYFSSMSGDDSRSLIQAQDPATPWKSLDKLNALRIIKAGDSILFKRNEIFSGTILANASGTVNREIVYGSYGTGVDPVISALKPVQQWTYYKDNIYYSDLDVPALNLVIVNGQIKGMGRYPNRGYRTYETHTGNTSISDPALSGYPDWTGAEVVIRKNNWIIDRHAVISHSGHSIFYATSTSYGNNGMYSPVDKNGYFIQGHLGTLDQYGEWFYDTKAKRLYVHFGSDTLRDAVVQVSCVDRNVTVNTNNYITFSQLIFEGANTRGAYLTGTNNVKFTGCTFRKQGGDAIYGIDVASILVKGGVVQDALNNGIWMESKGDQVVIDSVLIRNAGTIPGAGRSGDGNQQGIIINGSGTKVRYCSIINTGYNGISFTGSHVLIQNNLIDTFCTVKDDGGGIYTYTGLQDTTSYTNRLVKENIILNGLGTAEQTNEGSAVHVHGIYIDDNCRNIEVSNNTVTRCGESGIFIHNAKDLQIIQNTVFNNRSALLMTQDGDHPGLLIRNNIVRNNLFFSKNRIDRVAHFSSADPDIQQFGVFNNNYYCRPLDQHFIISEYVSNPGNSFVNGYDLPDWQNRYGHDPDSKIAPVTIKPYMVRRFKTRGLFTNTAFDAGINGVGNWSPSNSCNTDWVKVSGLDTGALQVTFSPSKATGEIALVTLETGAVDSSRNYVLRFSLLGTKKSRNIQVYLRKKEFPYQDVSNRVFCSLTNSRTENEVLLSATASEKDVFLVFEVNRQDSTLWIDNVQLSENNVTMTDPDEYIRFEYNAGREEKRIYLDDIYKDVADRRYAGSFTLAPFTSVILMKVQEDQSESAKPQFLQPNTVRYKSLSTTQPEGSGQAFFRQHLKQEKLLVYPVPVKDMAYIKCPAGLLDRTVSLRVVRVSGAEAARNRVFAGSTYLSLNMSELPGGIYYVELSSGSSVYHTILLKQ